MCVCVNFKTIVCLFWKCGSVNFRIVSTFSRIVSTFKMTTAHYCNTPWSVSWLSDLHCCLIFNCYTFMQQRLKLSCLESLEWLCTAEEGLEFIYSDLIMETIPLWNSQITLWNGHAIFFKMHQICSSIVRKMSCFILVYQKHFH